MLSHFRCGAGGLAGIGLAAVVASPCALASGYAVGQDSISGAGSAYAGGSAAATDASTVWANPAGMLRFDGLNVHAGGHVLVPRIDFDDRGSVNFDGTPLTGGDGGNGGQSAVVTNAYATWRVGERIAVGLGLNAPFGLVTKYDYDWRGRYNEVTTSLLTINANPSVAVRVTEQLTFGAGLDVQYVHAKLLQAVDFGSACAAALGAPACAAGFGLTAQGADGYGMVKGNDVGFGYNLGVLFEPTAGTRFGLHYRSKIDFDIDLDASFVVPGRARNFLAAAGTPNAFTNGGARTDLTVPESLSGSVYHELTPRWAVMADVTWTRWTRFERLRVEFDEPTTPTNLLLTRWNDVLRVSAGATYAWNDQLTLRGGVAFDESPIDDTFRGPGVPDSDRFVLGLGFGYRLSDHASIDVAYQHLFLERSTTRRPSPTGSRLIGEFDVDVDVASVGLNWRF